MRWLSADGRRDVLLANADGAVGARVIYVDGPFEYALDRDGVQRPDAGQLRRFLEYMRRRLLRMRALLARDGALFVQTPPTTSHYLKVVGDQVFGRAQFVNEIVWCHEAATRPLRGWSIAHQLLLVWERERGASKLGSRGPHKRLGPDYWSIPLLSTESAERTRHPYQTPCAVLQNIVAAATDEGDLVLDPFAGSGTSAVVAESMGRRWIAIERSRRAIGVIKQRTQTPRHDKAFL